MGSDDMKSVEDVDVSGRRETVETVLIPRVAEYTSLKDQAGHAIGVNERITTTRWSRIILHSTPATHSRLSARLAFTLIELLVVIAIMSVLAALIIPITGAVTRHKLRSRTRAEMRSIETAIEDYKTKKGYYPPDNPGGLNGLNQLYYELSGTTVKGTIYTTLDGNATLDTSTLGPPEYGGFQGFVNTTKGAGDEGMAAQKFIRELKPTQVAETTDTKKVKILVGSVGWDSNIQLGGPIPPKTNPFRYISTNPTNNPKSFDLWIDIIVQGKTNRIGNWSEDAIVL
jgi:prepilin-type N-terminal cleavage/methylation domain-containing protein